MLNDKDPALWVRVPEEEGKLMNALEYMEKQISKHQNDFYREFKRGVPDKQLYDILDKVSYYKAAADALRKVGGFNA